MCWIIGRAVHGCCAQEDNSACYWCCPKELDGEITQKELVLLKNMKIGINVDSLVVIKRSILSGQVTAAIGEGK